jgi:hypothetical protein
MVYPQDSCVFTLEKGQCPTHVIGAGSGEEFPMPDNRSLRDYRDKKRINMNETYEVAYWKQRFGVSGQQLAGAVRAVGTSVKKVGEYLFQKRVAGK